MTERTAKIGKRVAGALSSRRGISIIELVILLSVLLVLMYAFVPRFSRDAIVQKKVYTVAHNIAADLRYSRRLSISAGPTGNSGKYYGVTLSTVGTSTDTVLVQDDSVPRNAVKTTTLGDADVQMWLLSPSTDSVYFSYRGEPNLTNGATFRVRDVGNQFEWYVSVEKTTGRVFMTKIQ